MKFLKNFDVVSKTFNEVLEYSDVLNNVNKVPKKIKKTHKSVNEVPQNVIEVFKTLMKF